METYGRIRESPPNMVVWLYTSCHWLKPLLYNIQINGNCNWTGQQLEATVIAVQLCDQSGLVQLPVANWTSKHYTQY